MKKHLKQISFYLALVLVGSISFASCTDKDEDGGTPEPNPNEFDLTGELTTEKTLLAGNTYSLIGGYEVKNGGNLIIEEGVKIVATRTIDGQPDYILVEQGGKINAKGTKEKPVVMTSSKEEPGAWGGLHICGKAPVNLAGGTGLSEIGDATYGGTEPADNSG